MNCPICGSAVAAHLLICPVCGCPLTGTLSSGGDALPAGALLRHGQFRLEGELGQGGFGITYLARDQTLHRQVAIKELFLSDWKRNQQAVQQPGKLSDAEFQDIKTKFLAEARVLAGFNDPSIVRVYDQFSENNTAYLVMEYLQGETLEERLTRELTLPAADVVSFAERVLAGLRLLHRQGLLHRDIKPGNIFLEDTGRVVLIDFGSARAFQAGKTTAMTQHLTPGYAPLEQYAAQGKVGPPSDLYSLGATMYHALKGQMPPAASQLALGTALPALPAGTPAALAQVIRSAMKVRMDERPQSVDEFLNGLTKPPPAPRPPALPPPAPPQFPGSKPALDYLKFMRLTPTQLQERLTSGAIQVSALPPEVRRHLVTMGWLDAQGRLTFQYNSPPAPPAPPPAPVRPPRPSPAPAPPPPVPLPALPEPADIRQLWTAIVQVPRPGQAPLNVPVLSPVKPVNARSGCGTAGGVVALVVLAALILPFAGFIGTGVLFVIALAVLFGSAAGGPGKALPAVAALDLRISQLQARFQTVPLGQAEFDTLYQELERIHQVMQAPADLVRQRQREARQTLLTQYLDAELRRYPLEPGTVSGIGVQRVKSLQQHGIRTAYDVTESRLQQVSGFGEKITRDLLAWRRGLERHVETTMQRLPDDLQVTQRAANELWALREQLAQGEQALQQVLVNAAAERDQAQRDLNAAVQQRETLNQ
ncbi:protein kinase [Deinococcus oregonensis]|uniref:Protein kinase n=1 Tax=Deinococcus oregonensis TaxID=1805970 RepID=A0ABV6B4M2_9DEIO